MIATNPRLGTVLAAALTLVCAQARAATPELMAAARKECEVTWYTTQ
jgi:hypothetical protein